MSSTSPCVRRSRANDDDFLIIALDPDEWQRLMTLDLLSANEIGTAPTPPADQRPGAHDSLTRAASGTLRARWATSHASTRPTWVRRADSRTACSRPRAGEPSSSPVRLPPMTAAGSTARRSSDQFVVCLEKTIAVVRAAGGGPEHIGRMTVYVTDVDAYLESRSILRDKWLERMGNHYPAMALVGVTRLVDDGAVVEIEATAVVPAS